MWLSNWRKDFTKDFTNFFFQESQPLIFNKMLDFLYHGYKYYKEHVFWNCTNVQAWQEYLNLVEESFRPRTSLYVFFNIEDWFTRKLETYLLCIEGSGEHFYSVCFRWNNSLPGALMESIAWQPRLRGAVNTAQYHNWSAQYRAKSQYFTSIFRYVACIT